MADQLRHLLRMREAKTDVSFASDKFRADLLLFDMKSRDLKRSLKQGAISREDFVRLANEYNSRVKQLYEALAEEESLSAAMGRGGEAERASAESDLAEVQRSVRKQVRPLVKKKFPQRSGRVSH